MMNNTQQQENTINWVDAEDYLDELIREYSQIGSSGIFGLLGLNKLKNRYINGERSKELYDEIMESE